jgi:hypothetical protein
MTFATASGREMSDRCDALMLVVRALARLDMARCSLGGMGRAAGREWQRFEAV